MVCLEIQIVRNVSTTVWKQFIVREQFFFVQLSILRCLASTWNTLDLSKSELGIASFIYDATWRIGNCDDYIVKWCTELIITVALKFWRGQDISIWGMIIRKKYQRIIVHSTICVSRQLESKDFKTSLCNRQLLWLSCHLFLQKLALKSPLPKNCILLAYPQT